MLFRSAFRGEDELQRIGSVDCGDVDALRGGIGGFFAIAILLALDGGAFDRGILRHRADGGDEYDSAESRTGSIARADYGGLRDDVYGRAADWVADRGWGGETHWGAVYVSGVWDFVFLGEHVFYFSRGDAFAAAAGSVGNGLRGIWAVKPARFGEWRVSGLAEAWASRVDCGKDGIDCVALGGQRADGIRGRGIGG